MTKVYVMGTEWYPVTEYHETDEQWDWVGHEPVEVSAEILKRYDDAVAVFEAACEALKAAYRAAGGVLTGDDA